MDEDVCYRCGGYGECWVNGIDLNGEQRLESCSVCNGSGLFRGTRMYAGNEKTAQKALSVAIEAFEKRSEEEKKRHGGKV